VSVDTHLQGKNTTKYKRVFVDDVKVLVAPSLIQWATSAHLSTRSRGLWRGFKIDVNHKHQPT
jgi:hypothetical protein